MSDCSISYEEPIGVFAYVCNCKEIKLENVQLNGVKGKLVKSWVTSEN